MIISYFPALYTCFFMTVCPDHYPGCTYRAVSLCLKSVCVMFGSKGVFYYSNHVFAHVPPLKPFDQCCCCLSSHFCMYFAVGNPMSLMLMLAASRDMSEFVLVLWYCSQ